MHLGAPYLAVLCLAEGGVLAVVVGTERRLSGREVVRIGGQPRSSVARVLRRLVEHGVVEARRAGAGAVLLYLLNREHLASEPVEVLITLRWRLVERIRGELATWLLRPFHASLFGFAARWDGDTQSDIDLFLVRRMDVPADDPGWREQLDGLATRIERWTGNRASLADVSLDDVARLARVRPPVVGELEREAITLQGPPAQELLAGAIP